MNKIANIQFLCRDYLEKNAFIVPVVFPRSWSPGIVGAAAGGLSGAYLGDYVSNRLKETGMSPNYATGIGAGVMLGSMGTGAYLGNTLAN